MGMYNVIFGMNQLAPALLATLGRKPEDCGRFRDCYISGGKIAVYTRNGGGNREDYQEIMDKLAQHPCYLSDEDDDFDCTYATIYFSFPKEFEEELKKLDSGETINPSERWLKAIEAISGGGERDASSK